MCIYFYLCVYKAYPPRCIYLNIPSPAHATHRSRACGDSDDETDGRAHSVPASDVSPNRITSNTLNSGSSPGTCMLGAWYVLIAMILR